MNLTIHFLGQARQLAPTGPIKIEVPEGVCVNDALPVLLADAGERLSTILADENGALRSSVMAILRDETIDPAEAGLLSEGDELSLLPPMSGG